MLNKRVVLFEADDESLKCPNGHRLDTPPIIEALQSCNWEAEALCYQDEAKDEIINYCTGRFDAYINRINPGTYRYSENNYFSMLRTLSDSGVLGMPHPDVMLKLGAKEAITQLKNSEFVREDTYVYQTYEDLCQNLPQSLINGERVLKQNRGYIGKGVWRISVDDSTLSFNKQALPSDTKIKCTEALDNHVEYWQLGEFMKHCKKYFKGDHGKIIDVPFISGIKQGEVRLVLIGNEPVTIIHKKPAEHADAFSAAFFAGAKYSYHQPDEWQELVQLFLSELPKISKTLAIRELPLIWTADFIPDLEQSSSERYLLGEINCACLGFSKELIESGIQNKIANEIIRRVEQNQRYSKPKK